MAQMIIPVQGLNARARKCAANLQHLRSENEGDAVAQSLAHLKTHEEDAERGCGTGGADEWTSMDTERAGKMAGLPNTARQTAVLAWGESLTKAEKESWQQDQVEVECLAPTVRVKQCDMVIWACVSMGLRETLWQCCAGSQAWFTKAGRRMPRPAICHRGSKGTRGSRGWILSCRAETRQRAKASLLGACKEGK